MKRKLIVPILLSALLAHCEHAFGQADIHFSQFYETSILRNPSLTGIFTNDYKFGAYYRTQWSSISNPFVTALVYGELRLPVSQVSNDFVSFGLLAFTDKAGSVDQKISGAYPAVNYSKSLNTEKNMYLSVGFTGGYNQYSFDPGKATFNNQYINNLFNENNPSLENIKVSKMSMWDLDAGINFNSSAGTGNNVTYILGVSGYHLTQPKFSYNNVAGLTENMRYNVNGALGFGVEEAFAVQVYGNYAMQGTYTEIMGGALFTYTQKGTEHMLYALTGGLFYRVGDAVIPVVKMKYKSTSIGFSYDVNISNLQPASKLRGGYELTFSVAGDFYDKSGVLRKTVCPKF